MDEALADPGNRWPFLNHQGEMGTLMRNFDWAHHPLGLPDAWPAILRSTLSTALHSKFPMFIFWGPEAFCFYNDAYRPSLGVPANTRVSSGSREESPGLTSGPSSAATSSRCATPVRAYGSMTSSSRSCAMADWKMCTGHSAIAPSLMNRERWPASLSRAPRQRRK